MYVCVYTMYIDNVHVHVCVFITMYVYMYMYLIGIELSEKTAGHFGENRLHVQLFFSPGGEL